MIRRYDPWLLGVVVSTLCAYVLALPIVLDRLNPLTGDEPFYVMTAISVIRDRSLDETENYARRAYEEFYPPQPLPADWRGWPAFPRTLPPHPAVTEREGLFTKHGLGLSFLIAVPYELLGRVGAMGIVMLCAALLAGQMYLLALSTGSARLSAALVAALLALSLPIAPYALLIFPEIPAALVLIYAIRRCGSQTNLPLQWIASGAAIGFLPWLHQRFALTSLVLAVYVAYRVARSRDRWAAAAVLPIAVGGITLIAYNVWLYGRPIQNTADHAGFNTAAGTLNGFFGLLLDAQWGLLIAAPVYVLAIAAAPLWLSCDRRTALIALAAVAPYVLIIAAYRVWWGEWGPPARYLVPIVPLAAAPLALLISRAGPAARSAAGVLFVPGLLLTAIGVGNPQRLYHHPDGHNQLVNYLGVRIGIDLASGLAAFQPLSMAPLHERLAWGMALIAVLLALVLLVYLVPRLGSIRSAGPVRASD
jgi:hypothetical protein